MDKLFIYRTGNENVRECVSCGFREAQTFETFSRAPETRVTKDHGLNEPRALKLLDPGEAPVSRAKT